MSYKCEAHQSEPIFFCLRDRNPIFLCAVCVPDYQSHEMHDIKYAKLLNCCWGDDLELKRRKGILEEFPKFLDDWLKIKDQKQSEAKKLMSTFCEKQTQWLEENNRCFTSLQQKLRNETDHLLDQPKPNMSPVTKALHEKFSSLHLDSNSETVQRLIQIPEEETLKLLIEQKELALSRASEDSQTDYDQKVLDVLNSPEPTQQVTEPVQVTRLRNECDALRREVAEVTEQANSKEEQCTRLTAELAESQRKTELEIDVRKKAQAERNLWKYLMIALMVACIAALVALQVPRISSLTSGKTSELPRSTGFPGNKDYGPGPSQTLQQSDWPGQPKSIHFTTRSGKMYQKLGPYTEQETELTLVWRDDDLDEGHYTGQWNSRNKKHGYGRFELSTGEIYEGYWKNGTRTGRGRLIEKDGSVYNGDFLKDKRSGLGIQNYVDGSVYTGTWVNDDKQGIGYMKAGEESGFPGDEAYGEWFQAKLHGRGAYFQRDGRMYVGNFQRYKKEGKGLQVWSNGGIYYGDWKSGLQSGEGIYLDPNGDVYRGEWVNGVKSGNGTLTHPGLVDRGVWTNDVLG